MLIRQLFKKDINRKIPPVVSFHDQDSAKLQEEVSEYIITGGYPTGDPRAADGIHEQFVKLLKGIRKELDRPDGVDLPACWISGFYGSGKSSFAKLLGLALDGRELPDGTLLCDALFEQDHSPKKDDFRQAWDNLVTGLQPVAVVFDIGTKAHGNEHVHSVIVGQVLERFGYSQESAAVASYELKLQLEGRYDDFLKAARELFGKPWTELKDTPFAEDRFSTIMHRLFPEQFATAIAWIEARSGSGYGSNRSVDEAVQTIRNIIEQRCPGRTLFIVVDEVSQYVLDNQDRMLALQALVESLKKRLKGQVWLLATGQQKLEDSAGNANTLSKLKDRFPSALRVHLGAGNIRDVLHKRLLRKDSAAEPHLRDLYQRHRPDLCLYAYRGEDISERDFVDMYPLLPGQIDLLLKITSSLRSTNRAQGDSHAIRGLLQLLGDLFREQRYDEQEVGLLISIDRVYDVLHTALDTDVQNTLVRGLQFCTERAEPLLPRVLKAVALLELIQETDERTTTELIARCLYERLGDSGRQEAVQSALDMLARENLLELSEKLGYRIQSSAGRDWRDERDGYVPSQDQILEQVREGLRWAVDDVDRPKLEGVSLPWRALFSDGSDQESVPIKDERKYTVVTVDFQFTSDQGSEHWVPTSHAGTYKNRIVWVVGERDGVRDSATRVIRSERMIDRYARRQSSLADAKQRLLTEERNLLDSGKKKLADAVKAAFMLGEFYFRGRQICPREEGPTFGTALTAVGQRVLPEMYPHVVTFSISDKDILYLIESKDLAAPPGVFCESNLGLLTMDAGRYEPTASGQVPRDVMAHIAQTPGVTGSSLLAHFGSPPHGVPSDVIKATIVGLLRARKLRIHIPRVGDLTSVRDEGARELLKETGLRAAELHINGDIGPTTPRDRIEICKMFKEQLDVEVGRTDEAIADQIALRFGGIRERLTEVAIKFRRLPSGTRYPSPLANLEKALENCRRSRQVDPTVSAVREALPALRDGLCLLRQMETDLNDEAIRVVRQASEVLEHQWPQLAQFAPSEGACQAALGIQQHVARERPWEETNELVPRVETLVESYHQQRRNLLHGHAVKVDAAIDRLKRQDGYDRLTPDACHQVLSPVREGAQLDTDDHAVAPPLAVLDDLFQARLEAAHQKALARLDDLVEQGGGKPTVEVQLGVRGQLIRSVQELDRLLTEVRQRVVCEIEARHQVRLR